MSDSDNPHLDDASSVWAVVEKQLDAFCQAWEQAPPAPNVADFVGDHDPALRRLILIDLIKVDLEYRWKDPSLVRPIEDYFAAWPELVADGGVPAELLYEEIFHRRQHGETIAVSEYLHRYPQSATALRRLAGISAADVSTALSHGRLTRHFSVGDSIDDFELRVELGRGAFGVVFLAIQRSLQRTVALKLSANKGTEAQVLSQLEHPNIVRVYDRRVIEEQDLQLFYMQYVRGGTLQGGLKYVQSFPPAQWHGRLLLAAIDQQLDDHGEVIPGPTLARISLSESSWLKTTCDFGIQLASALDYAHQVGVLHRDIKPANILLTADGVAKLADFNISCCSKLDGASPAAYFGGSLAYMSPEQLEAYNPRHDRDPESLDGRSDVYATGVVVWEMLTGGRPFHDEKLATKWEDTLAEMTARRKRGLTDVQWSRLPKSCPSALRTFFQRCLDPEPDNRFPTAGEMIRLLRIAGNSSTQGMVAGRAGWIQFARRWPYLVMLLAALAPNLVAAAFVWQFNHGAKVVESDTFQRLTNIVNGSLFPVGAMLVAFFTLPVADALKRKRKNEVMSRSLQELARRRSVQLGKAVLLIGIGAWMFAAIVYPVVLHWSGKLEGHGWGLFASNALGGLIAGTYPYFIITYTGLLSWYPTFLESGTDDASELRLLSQVARDATVAEILAASLPMLAIMLLTFGLVYSRDRDEHVRAALAVLSFASLMGFGVLFWISRRIRAHVDMLIDVLKPLDGVSRLSRDTTAGRQPRTSNGAG